ncbi:Phosphatidylinositol phosphate synthase @ Archaetidylinositol phosphate synthase [hydrothermal vent metagenome]|uniref:Phosphatidylinositol phosphate synthase @ Archaetidylinositol phosphate synthase n=1 Tax=hydrothermal vent metagenome TaxID=652676 RepID=A0A3B0VNJ1_9ZZZZ
METNSKTIPPVKERKTLTDFIRAKAQFIIDPIVTHLARYRFSPDALTVTGMLSHFLFAWLIANGQMTWAGVTMFFITPLDALDGALARKLGRKQGGFGAFLDSSLDRLAEIILFGGFILYYVRQEDTVMLGVAYLAITGSIMVSYTRARAEALGYDCKVGIASRVERYFVLVGLLFFNLPQVALIILAIATYITVGQRMLHVWQQAYREQEADNE